MTDDCIDEHFCKHGKVKNNSFGGNIVQLSVAALQLGSNQVLYFL